MSDTITNKKDVENKYSALLKDSFFDQLSLETNKPNIFRALGVSDYEIRHSNFLAWLLDPHENHGLGDIVLKKFFHDVLIDDKAKNISIITVANLDISKVEIRREWKNIDILIITESFIICVENKMWATESKLQLAKYEKLVKEEFPHHDYCFVFLTPNGQNSSKPDLYIDYSYREVAEILTGVLKIREYTINPSIRVYLNDYITLIKQNIMSDDTTNYLAKQLYLNHKDLFDFVLDNRPDYWDDFYNILSKKVKERGWVLGSKNKGYVRFMTKDIEPLILRYNKANGWPKKEAFLFEFYYTSKNLKFITVVSPPIDYQKYDKRIVEIMDEMQPVKIKLGEKWKVHFRKSITWNVENAVMNWNEDYDKKLDDFIDRISPIVGKVEAQFLKYEDELKALKAEFNNE
jgi:hypothetical protein